MTGSLQHTYDPVDNAFLDATTEDTTKVKFSFRFCFIELYVKKNSDNHELSRVFLVIVTACGL